MIHRRKFLTSSAVAIGTLSGLASRFAFAGPASHPDDRRLRWRCDIIRTMPHGLGRRAPVVTGVSLQPRGNQLAIVGDDHYLRIYDFVQKKFVSQLKDHTDWVRVTRFSPDGKLLASAGNDRRLRIWNAENFQQPPTVHPHSSAIIDLDFTSDSSRLATVGFGSELRIYDLSSRRIVRKMQCECPDNHAVAFTHDDRLVAAGGRSGWIRVWNTATGEMLHQFQRHRQRIRSLAFTPDDEIVSCGEDQKVQITRLDRIDQPRSLAHDAAKLYDVQLLDDDVLATCGSDNLIHIWRMKEAEPLGTLEGHRGTVSSLDFSGNRMASGGYDTQVRVWHYEKDFDPATRHTKWMPGWNQRVLN